MIVKSVGGANWHFCPWMGGPIKAIFVSFRKRRERTNGMKKPSSRIREEIAKLQEQLRQAETREAERIGRIALKAGLGEIELDETELLTAFEKLAARFCERPSTTPARNKATPSLATRAPESGAEGV